jgi:hypothetical protein
MGGYNAATPIVDGQTIIYAGSGRGAKAVKIEKTADGFAGKELWSSTEKHVVFNTPVLKNGLLYGLSGGNELFCINTQNGQLAWSAPIQASGGGGAGGAGAAGGAGGGGGAGAVGGTGGAGGAGRPGGAGGPGGRGRGGGRGGFGSIVDAGSVLLALTPGSELVVFQPSEKAYTEVARLKVADTETHAYPVVSGNRVFIKDKESLALWTID